MTTATAIPHPVDEREAFAWATPTATALLILAVLAVRIAYLAWLSPIELAGDEAYYWEWSRHLSLSYCEKGPGLAWLIALSTHLFGISAATVRLPVAVISALSAWAIARLASACAGGDARPGFFAALLFCLTPAFVANAQICTQDGPIILCWIALTAAGLRLVRHWHDTGTQLSDWLGIGALLGIGFLFKQSILLFVPSIAIYAWLQRRRLTWRRVQLLQAGAGALLTVFLMLPMVIWNQQHHWPTLAHTLGHLGAPGGDQVDAHHRHWNGLGWFGALVGAQIGAVGPGALLLMAMGGIWAYRRRAADSHAWHTHLWLLSAALPSLAFFAALSFTKPVIGSWPFPGYTPLVALAGILAVVELPRHADLMRNWLSLPRLRRPKAGFFRRAPETPFRSAWDTAIVYGLAGWLLICFPTWLGHLPVIGRPIRHGVLSRITGSRAEAADMSVALASVRAPDGTPVIPVTRYYMTAALRAFYMPGHPIVCNAGTQLGKQKTSYDFWTDTDLAGTALLGRTMLLDAQGAYPWAQVLSFDELRPVDQGRYYLGIHYRGIPPTSPFAHRQ